MDISNFFSVSLTDDQANENIKKYGLNKIEDTLKITTLELILNQLKSPLIIFLIIIGILMFFLKDYTDVVVIFLVIVVNTFVGYFQELKAQNAVESLKSYLSPKSKVIRNGYLITLESSLITKNDIISLESGDRVPADGTILASKNLQVDESQLTGESFPAIKDKENNKVFMGTFVTSGRAIIKIESVGMSTKLGQITKVVSRKDKDITPLEKDLKGLTKKIMFVVIAIVLFMFFLGVAEFYPVEDIARSSVSLGISAIPEGLPVVITITLAIGVFRMGKKNAVIRNLASASTLASTDVICVDKTGTITEGNIIQSKLTTYKNNFLTDDNNADLLKMTVLCNDAYISKEAQGDLMDIAILKYAQNNHLNIDNTRNESPRIDEIPFDSEYKYQATLNTIDGKNTIIVKGAPNILLNMCAFKNDSQKKVVKDYFESLGESGFRTIGIASKHITKKTFNHEDLTGLKFEGVLVFSDPIRKDVQDSLRECQESGINIIMLTGDFKNTANAIATQVGILTKNKKIIKGDELDTEESRSSIDIDNTAVIYSATPSNKVKLIDMLLKKNHVVSMTGDGVNDAPALVKADIGIAMGQGGTDVAKQSADMVLLDNKFSTIVSGLEEARVVFENLKKVITYLFITSVGEVITILSSLFLGLPLPLLGSQLLWLNLVTDGFLDVTLATEPEEKDVMKNSSKRYKGSILDPFLISRVLFYGIYMGVLGILFFILISSSNSIEYARTATLIFLAVPQWFIALMSRSEKNSIFKIGIFKNKPVIIAIIIEAILLTFAVYNSFMNMLLKTIPVSSDIWIYSLIFGLSFIIVEEFRKFIFKRI